MSFLPIAATSGADKQLGSKSPVSGVRNTGNQQRDWSRTPPAQSARPVFDYNARKLQLLTLPGFQGLPERLLYKILPKPGSKATNILGDKPKVILLLYAGADDDKSLKSAAMTVHPDIANIMVEIDISRGPTGQRMLNDNLYLGRSAGITGGPNCRSWSILRRSPKTGAPEPVRDRSAQGSWGSNCAYEP